MKILLNEEEIKKAISSFYKVDETYIKTSYILNEQNYYTQNFQIDLPKETQITITDFKNIKVK